MSPSFQEWENLCLGCGRCCFEKVEHDDGSVVVTNQPCRFLDVATRRCKVYERRFEVCSDCLHISESNLAEFDWLPEDCGYVQYIRRTRGPEAWRPRPNIFWREDEP